MKKKLKRFCEKERKVGAGSISHSKMYCYFLLLLFILPLNLNSANKTQNLDAKGNNKRITLYELFSEIEKHSDYVILYKKDLIGNDMVTSEVDVKNVEETLEKVLPSHNLDYTISGRQIVITQGTKASVEQNNEAEAKQQKEISGIVKDENGEPMIGVTVLEHGTNNGTITDIDGKFKLSIEAGVKLQISYMGYETQNLTVGNQSYFNIVLQEDQKLLDEIVVVGYGTVKKSDLTGSVASVTSKAFKDQPTSSINSVLSGRAPGVAVRRTSAAPGSEPTIRIRGANSVYGSNDPLIVVDGNYGMGIPNALDIESIEVLKDASATAIYGSRGANGVILIQTKRGKSGKPRVTVNADVSIDDIYQRYDMMDASEVVEFNKMHDVYPFSDEQLAAFKGVKGTDWQDEIFRTGVSQSYKATVSGGTDALKYYISPDYSNATGLIRNTEHTAYSFNSKFDLELSKRVSIQVETALGHKEHLNKSLARGGSKTDLPIMAALSWSPTEPVYTEDGKYQRLGVGTGTLRSPVLLTTPINKNLSNYGRVIGNVKVKIIEGLEFDGKASYYLSDSKTRKFQSSQYTGSQAIASQEAGDGKTWLLNGFLTYNKTFANSHYLTAMFGFEEQKSESENFNAGASKLENEAMGWYNLGIASPNINVGSGYYNSALRSFFGRLNYSYDSRYYLTASFRNDVTSVFRPNKRNGYFPSFSLAWRLSEEKFMKDQDIFQNIKLRGGWGQTGNQSVGSYATYATLKSRPYTWGDVRQAGYIGQVNGNPVLGWETSEQLNLGLDFGIFNNRLSVSLDYYNKKTKDLLAPVAVPGYSSGDDVSIITNVGSIRNEGFEFNVNFNAIDTKDFAYEVNFNGAFNSNKVLDLGENVIIEGDKFADGMVTKSPFVTMPGQPLGTIYGLKYLGIWQEDQAEEAALFQQQPGDYRYEDLNGNHSYDNEDYQVIGNTNPKFTWGLNNHFSYKNFDLNILLEGVHGRDVLNWTYLIAAERIDFKQLYTLREAMNRWSPENPNAKFSKIGSTNMLNPISSHYMEDGSYVKLRNISLAYTFPRKIIPFADVRISVSAQNILTISDYSGYDPEISSSNKDSDDVNSGMDWFAYPNPRSYSFGLAFTF